MNLKKVFILLFMVFSVFGIAQETQKEIFFTATPSLSPDGKLIAFSYEGDIWIVPSEGGIAYRLTAMEGKESFPRFSPDGKWIAFSASPNGNSDIYVMPVNGGEIKQLTFHESEDTMDSWSWDSNYIYFSSNQYNDMSQFKINRTGGTETRLFENYFNNPSGTIENPITKELYFTDSWESFRFFNRKKYKGDHNPDIKSYNLDTGEYKVHTTYKGKDLWATIDNKGNVYFVSDRDNDEYNLFLLDDKGGTRLTSFDTSVKFPQVSANGEKIVFERDFQLYTYSIADKKSSKVKIELSQINPLITKKEFNVDGKISYFDLSPDGKKFAFVSRGELFVSDVKGKFVRKMNITPSNRVFEVKWLKDNKTLLFTRTLNGWANLFKIQADTGTGETQLTSDEANNRNLSLNHAQTAVLYLSGRNDLKIMDLETFKSRTLVSDELWGYYNSQPHFSPDDNYIVYTAYRFFEQDIFTIEIKTGKIINITDNGMTESDPFWSPDGKYIYFTADRYSPNYPRGGELRKIYRLPLCKFDSPFKSTEFDNLFKEEEKKETNTPKSAKDSKEKDKTVKPAEPKIDITFDLEKMYNRWQQISPQSGGQNSPYVLSNKEDTNILYLSNHDGNDYSIWKTTLTPFEKPKTSKIEGANTDSLFICTAKDKYYILANEKIAELNLEGNKVTPIVIQFTFDKNLESEFNQMFYELWSGLQENFYDDKFHQTDWKAIKEKYKSFLPYVNSRDNLRSLISAMLGELNASHLGFYSKGDEENTYYKNHTVQTGIIFENSSPYTVKSIIKDSAVDKKEIQIKPGDVLVQINGKKIDTSVNRESYFTGPSIDNEISLTFLRKSEKDELTYSVKIHPMHFIQVKEKLYNEWENLNKQYVDQKSDNRIAYIHMKDMGDAELSKFIIEMTTNAYKKEALILDLRYNTGGNVHDPVLNFLSQRPYTQWKYRNGKFSPQPNFAPSVKPIVLLINEHSLSDAEMTAAGFKELKLGKVIGTETYRWLIFTSGLSLVDGSFYRLPSWGCYTLDQGNIESNGVKPDIYIVTTFKNRVDNQDPQLDAAIKEIMDQLKK